MKMRRNHKQAGFTLIELVFAMAAFSIMLIVAVSGLLNAMTIYSQANVSRNNQQEIRSIADQVGRDIRSASGFKVDSANSKLCLSGTTSGNVEYSLDSANNNLVRKPLDVGDSCDDPLKPYNTVGTGTIINLTGPNGLRISSFSVKQISNPAVASPATDANTVQIGLSGYRGSLNPANLRERQFSNEFSTASAYLVRSGVQ